MKKLWLLGLLMCPLIWTDLFATMAYSKILFLQIFSLVAVVITFKESININKFLLSLVGLLLWAALSSLWATDSLLSWTGQYWRGTGLIFYYTILCLLLTQKADATSKEMLRKVFLYIALLISLVTSIHFMFIKGSPSQFFTGNPSATALILGCAIMLFFKKQLFKSRPLNYIFASLLTIGLLSTSSRSGIGSLFISLLIYCFIVRKDLRKKFLIGTSSVFSLVLIHYFFINSIFLDNIFLRTQSFYRLKIWSGSFNSFLDKPFLGWGFHGLYDGFWSNYPDFMGSGFQWIDNAHSLPLNILSELGSVGLVIMFASLFYLYKEYKESSEKGFWLSYSFYIFAYLMVQPIYIDSLVVIVLSYILFTKAPTEVAQARITQKTIKSISALAILLVTLIQINQNYNIHQAKADLLNSKDYRTSWREFSQSEVKLLDPFGSLLELNSTFNDILRQPNLGHSDKRIFSKLILNEFKKMERTSSHRPRYLDFYGVWLMRNNIFEDANDIFDQILKRSPNNSQILVLKGESQAHLGYQNNSLELFERAEVQDPRNVSLKMNLAKLYMDLGFKEKGIAKIKEASKLDPTNQKIKTILKQF